MASIHKALVGLGNPGQRYHSTRHNVGFMVLDRLRCRWGWPTWKVKADAEHVWERRGSNTVHLLKPLTYMNLSGQAVQSLRRQSPLDPESILCILDDFELPLGRLRLRENGSAGSHNGLKSLIAELGSQKFPRLRLGVGPLPEGWEAADFVLGRFTSQERDDLESMLEKAADCLECWLDQGSQKAMNLFNG